MPKQRRSVRAPDGDRIGRNSWKRCPSPQRRLISSITFGRCLEVALQLRVPFYDMLCFDRYCREANGYRNAHKNGGKTATTAVFLPYKVFSVLENAIFGFLLCTPKMTFALFGHACYIPVRFLTGREWCRSPDPDAVGGLCTAVLGSGAKNAY